MTPPPRHVNPGQDTTIDPTFHYDHLRSAPTQPEQPKRCDHECVCKEYREWYGTPLNAMVDGLCPFQKDCEHDTRSRSATAPTSEHDCISCSHALKVKAVQEATPAIRNATLDELQQVIFMDDKHLSKISEIGMMVYEEGDVQSYIESLRQQSTEAHHD